LIYSKVSAMGFTEHGEEPTVYVTADDFLTSRISSNTLHNRISQEAWWHLRKNGGIFGQAL
jgi:hypothetical protein